MASGLNPSCTVMASQVSKTRDRKKALQAVGAAPLTEGGPDRAKRAVAAAKVSARRFRRAQRLAEEGDGPCPMRAVLEAAKAGDAVAVERAVNLYGPGWRRLLDGMKPPR